MNNPLPRRDSLLARALVGKTNLQRAAEVATSLNPKEEERANKLVAQILDDAKRLEEPEEERLVQEEALENYIEESFDSDTFDEESNDFDGHAVTETVESQTRVGPIRIPSREQSGLFDSNIQLDESQIEAVESLAAEQYGCLIGAAGTGKTTVQKYLIQRLIYDAGFTVERLSGAQGLNIAVVAFTGMAVQVISKNLPTWLKGCAKTIHQLLEFKPEESVNSEGKVTRIFVPTRHQLNKLDHKILIIDEASMVGLDLWKQLLAALQEGTRIIMTGDLNQLPPIIGQPVFAYALSHWHVSELTKVHRQKEPGANRIVDVAHQILNGQMPTFDQTKGNPDWRVIGFKLETRADSAMKQILNILMQVKNHRVAAEQDPEMPFVYDPYRDRVMTAGNGHDDTRPGFQVQQVPLNEALSILIQPPDESHPRYIIDAGRAQKKFAVHLRVMATKNEAPDALQRVTNGMTGVIEEIVANAKYDGDRRLFGIEADVVAETRRRIADLRLGATRLPGERVDDSRLDDADEQFESLDASDEAGDIDFSSGSGESEDVTKGGGFASHSVRVRFDNGAVRSFSSKAAVESLQLAYCSTVAKCQGSQFDCAIIVCHHAQKAQLSREWLYTAVTRASKRVIILYTDYALRYAISRQKIHGRTIADKVQRYREMATEGVKTGYGARLRVNVPLSIEGFTGYDNDYTIIQGE